MDTFLLREKLGNSFTQVNETNIMGTYQGYNLTFTEINEFISASLYINADPVASGHLLENMRASYAELTCNCTVNSFNCLIALEATNMEHFFDIIDDAIDYCQRNNIMTSPIEKNFYKKKGGMIVVNSHTDNKDNVFLGIIGAAIGTIPGIILWLFVSHFGFIASICGLVIGLGAVNGYKFLSGGFSNGGVVICGIMILLATIVSVILNYAVYLVVDTGIGISKAIFGVGYVLMNVPEVWNDVLKDIGISIVFSFLGAWRILVRQ